jgi:hypothetical protein
MMWRKEDCCAYQDSNSEPSVVQPDAIDGICDSVQMRDYTLAMLKRWVVAKDLLLTGSQCWKWIRTLPSLLNCNKLEQILGFNERQC